MDLTDYACGYQKIMYSIFFLDVEYNKLQALYKIYCPSNSSVRDGCVYWGGVELSFHCSLENCTTKVTLKSPQILCQMGTVYDGQVLMKTSQKQSSHQKKSLAVLVLFRKVYSKIKHNMLNSSRILNGEEVLITIGLATP